MDWTPGGDNDRSITGFRIRHGSGKGPMSRRFYYSLRAKGLGPRETVLAPKKIIITKSDELAWEKARASPKGTEARLHAMAAARRLEIATMGGKASAEGPNHVSKQGRRRR